MMALGAWHGYVRLPERTGVAIVPEQHLAKQAIKQQATTSGAACRPPSYWALLTQ